MSGYGHFLGYPTLVSCLNFCYSQRLAHQPHSLPEHSYLYGNKSQLFTDKSPNVIMINGGGSILFHVSIKVGKSSLVQWFSLKTLEFKYYLFHFLAK